MTDEAELVEAARRGSATAFTALVSRYREKLFRFLLVRCECRADAEDALQDTLTNAYRYLNSYDSRFRFSTWLFRIAINNAARRPLSAAEASPEIADNSSDPLVLCITASERENLWLTASRVLSPEAFTATWLRYVEDMSVNDIAAVLDRSTSWTKVNLLRARRALERELAPRTDTNRSHACG